MSWAPVQAELLIRIEPRGYNPTDEVLGCYDKNGQVKLRAILKRAKVCESELQGSREDVIELAEVPAWYKSRFFIFGSGFILGVVSTAILARRAL